MFESDDSIFDKNEISGLSVVANENKEKFSPWHKPRKQWVRDKQWWGPLSRLLKKSPYKGITTLKYFGLPGADLLDVEYIKSCLSATDIQPSKSLLIHGFINNQKDKEYADSRMSILLDDSGIHADSQIDRFNFGSLSINKSASLDRVKAVGPYHFINLDFCNGIFKTETLESIYLLMDFQCKRQHGIPWLFCLTTRVDRDGVNEDLFGKLNHVLHSIDDDVVLGGIERCFNEVCKVIEEKILLSNELPADHIFAEIIQVCVVLWVVAYSLSHENKVELVSSAKYSVNQASPFPDMFSFVFRMKKTDHAIPDGTGLVGPRMNQTNMPLDAKIKLQIDALTKLAGSLDIDRHLEHHLDEKKACAEKTRDLLEKCGWDVSSYMKKMCPELM